ncbi:MAG: hypothetical protein ACK4TC_09405 [Sphingomonas pseudosanguinis]|uniref:hypothetical protein n=1 Tax=Sphingomonas pseudosanguinis TaxID=413712 RepID=UPI003919F5E4
MKPRPTLSVGPRVSDHALLRFLQRAGMDVEAVRASLSAQLATAHSAIAKMGGGEALIVIDGLTYVVRDGVVTTVLPTSHPADNARALRHGR